ncbi:MAG: DUF4136 domain-containing protein [Flavobacteriales bacterium]|jgi:hypothetical protein|tara:strand:- start:44 stop:577 length:534 start_codon:yes stop_codon:yes gene_type:complete
MKNLILLSFCLIFISCSSVRVFSDYDTAIDFKDYTTYAFFKPGIDEVEISDLDKKRILKAIEVELDEKQLTKSETPDLLINLAVKSSNDVYINQNNGFGYGYGFGFWNGWGLPNNNIATVSSQTNGMLFIDLIDTKTKQLVWQGKGKGYISEYSKKRDERIQYFVTEILKNYPPTKE